MTGIRLGNELETFRKRLGTRGDATVIRPPSPPAQSNKGEEDGVTYKVRRLLTDHHSYNQCTLCVSCLPRSASAPLRATPRPLASLASALLPRRSRSRAPCSRARLAPVAPFAHAFPSLSGRILAKGATNAEWRCSARANLRALAHTRIAPAGRELRRRRCAAPFANASRTSRCTQLWQLVGRGRCAALAVGLPHLAVRGFRRVRVQACPHVHRLGGPAGRGAYHGSCGPLNRVLHLRSRTGRRGQRGRMQPSADGGTSARVGARRGARARS